MKKMTLAMAATITVLMANTALAEMPGPWLVRLRAEHLSPDNKSDPIGGTGAADRLSVSNKTIPEIDISYFFTPSIALELVLTYPQKHTVSLDGKDIGSFKHVPPTLLAQYHFGPAGRIDPYLGAGVNYTNIASVNLLNGAGSLEHNSVGLALQAGIDYKIDDKWSLNFDVKKMQIRSDVFISGTKVSAVKVDPLMVGVGLGYRF